MSTRSLVILSTVLLAALSLHLLINVESIRLDAESEGRLDPLRIEGMAASHHSVPYTLNFGQQTCLIQALNQGVRLQAIPSDSLEDTGAEHIIIYRFNTPPLHVNLAGSYQNKLVFRCEGWEKGHWLIESQASDAATLLSQSYDP